jgi:hypothetical protein
MWNGTIRYVSDLMGDSGGAQAFGSTVAPGSQPGTLIPLATGGPQPVPGRPSTASGPSSFLAKPTAPQGSATTLVLPLPVTPAVPANYLQGDTIRILFKQTDFAGFNVLVASGIPADVIGEMVAAQVQAPNGIGYIDVTLNALGAWDVIGGGYL